MVVTYRHNGAEHTARRADSPTGRRRPPDAFDRFRSGQPADSLSGCQWTHKDGPKSEPVALVSAVGRGVLANFRLSRFETQLPTGAISAERRQGAVRIVEPVEKRRKGADRLKWAVSG